MTAKSKKVPREVASAPELPHEVAKQYGLHHGEQGPAEKVAPRPPIQPPSADVEDAKTDAAVDDIVAKESDELLAVQDARQATTAVRPKGFWSRVKHFFVSWWRNKPLRYATIIVLLTALATAMVIPKTRYFALNTLGVRSRASVVVVDETTLLPLKNVTVTLGNYQAETDVKGVAQLKGLKLGDYTLAINRLAFAPEKQPVTIGFGSNPLGKFALKAVGVQYVLQVSDYLSGKPVSPAEAAADTLNAVSDKQGKIVLTVEDTDNVKLAVVVSAPGYRPETLELDATQAATTAVQLVPAQKAVYVSKQSGTYDVYSADLDGRNARRLLPGTGRENGNISLVVSPDNTQAALVSTRDDATAYGGYALYALTVIDLEQGTYTTIDHAERIQLVDWAGSRLVYRTTVSGASAANSQRNRLISYNLSTSARLQLATANQFNALLSAGGYVYYAAASNDPGAALGLFRIKTDGAGRERVSDEEIWTVLRTEYNMLTLQAPDGWYGYDLSSRQITKTDPPATFATYAFADDSRGQRSVWAATHAGKSNLLLRDASSAKVTTLVSQSGLTLPVRWAGDKAVIYRLAIPGQTADYVVSPSGGQTHKIADVVPTTGYMQPY